MLTAAKISLALGLICVRKRLVHDAQSAFTLDRNTYKYGDCS